MEKKTLRDFMPTELTEWEDVRAYKMLDVLVTKEHCSLTEQDDYKFWPGTHKNVFYWVELENGNAVGWNENPARGWSFPVIKMKKEGEVKKFWCWLCKKKQDHSWVPQKGEGVADGRYRCQICDSMYYG